MHRIPIRQLMHTNIITIHPDQLAADAAQLMEEHHIRRLPVVDDDGCLVGIVTDSDVREAEAAGLAISTYEPDAEEKWLAVGDIMSHDVITISPDATVGELATRLMEHKIGGLPVVEHNPLYPKRLHLVGIITETDIFAMIANAWRAELEMQESQNPKIS